MGRHAHGLQAAVAIGAVLATVGCGAKNDYQPPPPPPVTIGRPLVQTVTDYIEETGTTEAIAFVEIRARVKGFLNDIRFKPNDRVKKGDVLYLIDPREYQAQVEQHEATVEVANAEYLEADARLKRGEQAYKRGAITAEEFGERKAESEVARANIFSARAALNEAKLQLSFTKVTSPVDGIVGKTLVYEGNLVGNADATHLTTVVKYDPIYATFSISERALLDVMESRGPKSVEAPTHRDIRLYLSRANDEGFPFEGQLEYTDLAVDESTGTYSLRGVFPNPDLRIVPGLFVQIRVPIGSRQGALLVPNRALGADQRGKYLLIVNSEGIVERHNVEAGTEVGDLVVIEQGIRAEDWVIIDGLQRARPGFKVVATKSEISKPPQAAGKKPVQPAQPATAAPDNAKEQSAAPNDN
jgi:RND family efflux transporter MFP subunit